jgi:clostripain
MPFQNISSEKTPIIRKLSNEVPIEEEKSSKALDKKWTIMIYMDGDNNLEGMAIDDLLELESGGGSNSDINVVVMIDRHYQYDTRFDDWAEARTYYVQPNTGPGLDSYIVRPSGEVDMGDGQTLRDFISFVRTSYPADNYYLDIWNHGSGIFGACVDDTDGGMLTVDEIQTAIKGATGSVGLDVISYDCCLMGTMEVAWEMADYCDYFIASEQNVPGDGFEYDLILNGLNTDTSMTPYELSQVIVDAYEQKYSDYEGACLSALNSTLVSNLAPLISDFAGNLSKTMTSSVTRNLLVLLMFLHLVENPV